ncbi:MAG: hypothetical protein PHR26_01980 [Candidatus ainarchaeum sp.]|nr:hypothetical protein [Candidatus ainarchaeum sp.]MDD3976170.1 hypothetical protein [Candidatus ainarchaeum sp.]
MTSRLYMTKLIGGFLFIFGIFFLILSITNLFNDVDFIEEYKTCITISDYNPEILDSCKYNASNGLKIVIRDNQVELTQSQYIKIYVRETIAVLFSILLIIIGDFVYIGTKKRINYHEELISKIEEKPLIKPLIKKKNKTKKITTKKNIKKKK